MRLVDCRRSYSSELQVKSHSPRVDSSVEKYETDDDCHMYSCDFRRAKPPKNLHSTRLHHDLHNPKHNQTHLKQMQLPSSLEALIHIKTHCDSSCDEQGNRDDEQRRFLIVKFPEYFKHVL